MRPARVLTGTVIVTILATLLGSGVCSAAEKVPPIITQAALLEKLESSAVPLILDVRTPMEFRSGHVPKALNIPHTELAYRLNELANAKDREVVVYCERGPRSSFAESVLRKAGFTAVRHLDGDMFAWRRNGLPMERPQE